MRQERSGFSLMEVMLATSILLGSSIVLIELATIGRKQADSAYHLNTAHLLCQAKLAEIVAGVTPIKMVTEEELEDNPGWLYSIESQPIRKHNLVAVRVSVFQEADESKRPIRYSLIRWLPGNQGKTGTTSDEETSISQRRDTPREGSR